MMQTSISLSSSLFAVLVTFVAHNIVHTSAKTQSVVFTFPPPIKDATNTQFKVGQNVEFTWRSTYPTISLELWQGPDDTGRDSHVELLGKLRPGSYTTDRELTSAS
jgi:hypothetical protein